MVAFIAKSKIDFVHDMTQILVNFQFNGAYCIIELIKVVMKSLQLENFGKRRTE
jgi:hypothetical protein